MNTKKLLLIPVFILHCAAVQAAAPVKTGLLDLATGPLLVSNSAVPNVFFMLDDSGSMDWESLMMPVWEACAYDPLAGGTYSSSACGARISDGTQRSYGNGAYRDFRYIYKNSDNKYSDSCINANSNSIEACPEAGSADWRFFSSSVNVTYYDPSSYYVPWNSLCTNAKMCGNSDFTAARSNPKFGTNGYNVKHNLGTSVTIKDVTGFPYTVWIDDKGYNGARPERGINVNYNTTPNGEADLWDSHIQVVIGTNDAKIYTNTYNPNILIINQTSTLAATLTSTTACYNVLGTKELVQQIFAGTLAYTSTDADGCRTLTQAKQNIANWYEFSRRRSLTAKGAIDGVLRIFPTFRYGLSVINQASTLFVESPAAGVTNFISHNSNLLSNLTSYEWPALRTPLLTGLEMAGEYYAGRLSAHPVSPIIHSCQQNFTLLITDGYWTASTPSVVTTDVDGDGYKVTLADVARYYYINDLSALPNDVLPNVYDPATYQHMVTFTVAFGLTGNLVDTNNNGWPNPVLTESSDWGNPLTSDPAKIDDLWHAAYNSKGAYSSAQSPKEITDNLTSVFNNVIARVGSAVGVAQNSTVLTTDSSVYRAQFDSQNWSGTLLAYPISVDGVLSTTPTWNTGCMLSGGVCDNPAITAAKNPGIAANDRVIITPNLQIGGTGGTPFRAPSNYLDWKVTGQLPVRVVNMLQFSPYSLNASSPTQIAANQGYMQHLFDYLRGDRTQETLNGGVEAFRDRKSILGDFVNSDPVYISPPARVYSDSFESVPYSTFKTTYQNRTPMVALGGNDGFMHIFDAKTGKEILAYLPSDRELALNLPYLSKAPYSHKYFVDGAPSEADIVLNNSWETILFGSLRNGGQSIFALKITDPSKFTEANAKDIFLWEFGDQNDPDMGYINGKIQIAKVRTNASGATKWAAIFGNGYNNTKADGFASTTGQAALYILFIEQGTDGVWTVDTDYIKIPVGPSNVITPNGLAEPFLVDIDGDQIVDYVYAGDLLGNLWKFDLRNTTPTNWKTGASILFTAESASAGNQPITSAPIARFHPNGSNAGILVYFGTGKFIEPSDNSAINQVTQSFYAIWDKLDGASVNRSALLQQKILDEVSQSFDTDQDGVTDSTIDLRQMSDYPINWATPNQNLGWYIDLQAVNNASNLGERQISQAILRNNNVIFTTMLPSTSICSVGGSTWLMELNADTGGIPVAVPFDLNEDGVFDDSDYIKTDSSGNAVNVAPGGQKSKVGAAPTPVVFLAPDKAKEIKVLSGATGLSTVIENPGKGASGRQSWRRLN